jgi:hypothetical protein
VSNVQTASNNDRASVVSTDLQAQRAYVHKIESEGFDFGLTVAGAFIRGIRDLGYKSTATALDELIDNAIQAEAANVDVIFGYDESPTKPVSIAVIDDGHGMDPDMIRLSVVWGGTHRENDRTGIGRYGYGLPSACVSQGRRFTVFSRIQGAEWHGVTLDLDAISRNDKDYVRDGKIVVPETEPRQLPSWVASHIEAQYEDGLPSGSVIVIDILDRLSWKTTEGLERNLLQHFGVTYRNFMREVNIYVNEKQVAAVDPLFLTPGARFYDDPNGVYAEALEPMYIEVKDRQTNNPLGQIKVRFSYMPPTFQRGADGKMNPRFPIMKDHNGILVLRDGRQIDIVTGSKIPWTTIQNPDWNWKVEVDFPPSLDEEFSMTTSKQQVGLSERIWEILRERGVHNAIQEMRRRLDQDKAADKAKREAEKERRASEEAMAGIAKFQTHRPGGDPARRQQESEDNLKHEVDRRVKESGLQLEVVERELLAEIKGKPYRLQEDRLQGAPFYRMEQLGGQKVLYLNQAHRFYTDVYAGPESTPRMRAALELLLFVLGECEIDATDDRRNFYETERGEWSSRLRLALEQLDRIDNVRDAVAAKEEFTAG